MLSLDIPGFGSLGLQFLVCDYNGTLALDGVLYPGVDALLQELSTSVDIHVVTADTFGVAGQHLAATPCELKVLPRDGQDTAKLEYVEALGPASTVCIGNGRNDRLMLKAAALGIALIQHEGAAPETVRNADVVCQSVEDALGLLLHPKRLTATLRL